MSVEEAPVPGVAAERAEVAAFLGVVVCALWADGRSVTAEEAVIEDQLPRIGLLSALDDEDLGAWWAHLVERYTQEGPQALLEEAAEVLDELRRDQAFALAVDVAFADRELTGEEDALLSQARAVLGVEEALAERVVEVLQAKHALPLPPTDREPPEGPEVEVRLDLSTPEALLAFPLAAALVDAPPGAQPRIETPLPRALPPLPPPERRALVATTSKGLASWGVKGFLEHCAAVLTPAERVQAFTLACDVVFADRKLTEAEHELLTTMRATLEVPPDRAARISDVLWRKHLR